MKMTWNQVKEKYFPQIDEERINKLLGIKPHQKLYPFIDHLAEGKDAEEFFATL